MTDKLPGNLLQLFQPRPPLRYLPHCDYAPEQRRTAPISGVAAFLEELRKPDPDYVPTESWLQRRDRIQLEKKERQEKKLKDGLAAYKPEDDAHIRGDPYRTLFVSRLSYEVKEPDLEREFGRFGPIERIRIVRDKTMNKQRGYAFIVYEREKDMKAAYKETDGIRIKDRRVLVDVERGRTVKGWKPRRLGGGLGGRGYTKIPLTRPSGPSFGGPPDRFGGDSRGGRGGGGFRGGFRGGPRGGGGFSGGNRFEVGSGRGSRGGLGYQGGGGRFGSGGGGREGGDPGFVGEAPPNAPTGPGGRRGGGYGGGGFGGGDRGDRGGGYGGGHGGGDRGDRGGYDRRGGGDRYGDRDDRGGGNRYSDRGDDHGDRGGGYHRKRPHEDGGYGGSSGGDRHRRRY